MEVDISSEAVEQAFDTLFTNPKSVEAYAEVRGIAHAQAELIKQLTAKSENLLTAYQNASDARTHWKHRTLSLLDSLAGEIKHLKVIRAVVPFRATDIVRGRVEGEQAGYANCLEIIDHLKARGPKL